MGERARDVERFIQEMEERRRAPRLEMTVTVSLSLSEGTLALTTQNLSPHGLLVTSAAPLPPGRDYEAELHLIATGQTLPCHLRPVWRKRARGGAWHIGFSFERLGRAGEGKIGKYLDLRRAHLTSFLTDFPIFRPLTHRDRTLLSGYCIHHLLAKNEILSREGDMTRTLYIIRSGMVRILKSVGGERRTVATASAGEIFGEASFLSREPHHSTIQAVIPSEVIGITGASYDYLRLQDPRLALKLAETLARFLVRRLRRTTAKLFSPGDPGEE
ncbi:MAG: cyclic nucleotide-binding domain-containing protein [Planctomycetes bacterium]|nr:cyclic nucleotide-binding domain-containing protein [Planctomycetota bacterium]